MENECEGGLGGCQRRPREHQVVGANLVPDVDCDWHRLGVLERIGELVIANRVNQDHIGTIIGASATIVTEIVVTRCTDRCDTRSERRA